MTALLVAFAALIVAAVASEIALGGRKVQTGLRRAVAVYAAVGLLMVGYIAAARGTGVFVFLVFWAGAFLSWFGLRSHIESSILLRMVYLLRQRGMTGEDLLASYESVYGPRQRVEELVRSGLVTETPAGMRPTPKGRAILAGAQWLRGDQPRARPAARHANDASGGG